MRATSILYKVTRISHAAHSSSSKGSLSSRRIVSHDKRRESRAPRSSWSSSSSRTSTNRSQQRSRQWKDRPVGDIGMPGVRRQGPGTGEDRSRKMGRVGVARKDVYPSRFPEKSYRSAPNNRDTRSGETETTVIRRKGPGYSAEMRKMAAEFALMRKEELERFSPQSLKPTSLKPKPSRPITTTKIARLSSLKPSVKATSKITSESPADSKESSKLAGRSFSRKAPSKESLIIPVIQEAPQFICINKPPALLSQPGLPGEGTILDLLRFQRPELTVQTVNRLDKNTSGAMILGRTDSAIRDLNLLFKENKIEKNYLAMLKPKPGSPLYTPSLTNCRVLSLTTNNSTITGILTKKTTQEIGKLTILQTPDSTSGYILTYNPETNNASITHFHVLVRIDAHEKLLMQFTPLTGKKHQLRLHAAFLLGAPVVGDHRYGYPQDDGVLGSMRMEDGVYKDGYALHCYRLACKEGSVQFDVTAGFPGGRWGDVWRDVKMEVDSEGFGERVRTVSREAGEIFGREEVRGFLDDVKGWAKGIRGPLVKLEIL